MKLVEKKCILETKMNINKREIDCSPKKKESWTLVLLLKSANNPPAPNAQAGTCRRD